MPTHTSPPPPTTYHFPPNVVRRISAYLGGSRYWRARRALTRVHARLAVFESDWFRAWSDYIRWEAWHLRNPRATRPHVYDVRTDLLARDQQPPRVRHAYDTDDVTRMWLTLLANAGTASARGDVLRRCCLHVRGGWADEATALREVVWG